MITKSNKLFIEESNIIHNYKYDYSSVDYKTTHEHVIIICHEKDDNGIEHGEFKQMPSNHLRGNGCPICAKKNRIKNKTTKQSVFLTKARNIHGGRYNYSKSFYKKAKEPIRVICEKHGEFYITPDNHISKQRGCPKCKESFLEKKVRRILEENDILYEYQKRFKWLGRQSLDFYLPNYNLAIECQGKQHFEPVSIFGGEKRYNETIESDKRKDYLCWKHGIKIIYYKI